MRMAPTRHASALYAAGQVFALAPSLTSSCVLLKHPFHLHGHHFWALAIGMGVYNDALDRSSLNTVDPPYRDVINIPMGGYAVLRFEVRACPSCPLQAVLCMPLVRHEVLHRRAC